MPLLVRVLSGRMGPCGMIIPLTILQHVEMLLESLLRALSAWHLGQP